MEKALAFGKLGALGSRGGFGSLGSLGGASGPGIRLSASTFGAGSVQGSAIGTLSVAGATGTPTFTLTDSHTNAVQVAGVNLQAGSAASSAGSFSITVHVTGVTPALPDKTFLITAINQNISAGSGSFVLTGDTLTSAYSLGADQGSFVLTGNTAALLGANTLGASQGSFVLSGTSAGLNISMPAAEGAFTFTGEAATLSSSGGGFVPTSTQSTNYLNRVAAVTGGNSSNHFGLSTNECVALDALITGIVTDFGGNTSLSTWPVFEALYAMANFSAAVANLNLVSSSFTLVPTNSPTFTADVGYTGGGTAYLDTQFNPTTGTKFLQSDAHIFAYMRSAVSSDVKSVFGTNGTSTNARIYPYFGGTSFMGVNNGNIDSMVATGAKFFSISRVPATGAASDQMYADTTTNGLVAWPSTAPTGTKLVLLADDATGLNSCTAPVALAGIGGGITPTQAGLLKTRLDTYNAAVP